MSYTESSIMRLNKDLVRMLLNYHGRFNNILDQLKDDLNKLTTKFRKLESDLYILRNVNYKLSDKLVVLERKFHANEQYARRECLEISRISAEEGVKDVEKKCWRFWMLSAPLLTTKWLKTAIVYPQKIPPKKLFSN